MTRTSFHLREAAEKAFAYAQAVKFKDLLFVSGCMSVDEQFVVVAPNDMASQLRNVYADIRRTLKSNGTDLSKVLKETIFVTDMDSFLSSNSVRVETYAGHAPPACTTVEVRRLAFVGQVVEIEVIAAV